MILINVFRAASPYKPFVRYPVHSYWVSEAGFDWEATELPLAVLDVAKKYAIDYLAKEDRRFEVHQYEDYYITIEDDF